MTIKAFGSIRGRHIVLTLILEQPFTHATRGRSAAALQHRNNMPPRRVKDLRSTEGKKARTEQGTVEGYRLIIGDSRHS